MSKIYKEFYVIFEVIFNMYLLSLTEVNKFCAPNATIYIDLCLYSLGELIEYFDKRIKRSEEMDGIESKTESVPDYLDRNIFPILLNAMEEMLIEAHRRDALEV